MKNNKSSILYVKISPINYLVTLGLFSDLTKGEIYSKSFLNNQYRRWSSEEKKLVPNNFPWGYLITDDVVKQDSIFVFEDGSEKYNKYPIWKYIKDALFDFFFCYLRYGITLEEMANEKWKIKK